MKNPQARCDECGAATAAALGIPEQAAASGCVPDDGSTLLWTAPDADTFHGLRVRSR